MNVLSENINRATLRRKLELYCDQKTEGESDVRWEINISELRGLPIV